MRGRKPCQSSFFISTKQLKFIPVRGRKPQINHVTPEVLDVEIYPREGTEIWSHRQRRRSRYSLNLTPQGDENSDAPAPVEVALRWNLSPWGDGNIIRGIIICIGMVEIYPREGAETFFTCLNCTVQQSWNLSPRGDENTRYIFYIIIMGKLKFNSVRGRKRSHICLTLSVATVEIYPREGTETP